MYKRLLLFESILHVTCAHKMRIFTVYNQSTVYDQRGCNWTGEGVMVHREKQRNA